MENRNGLLYPMMVIAAISVILFSVVGIATMTGYIPAAFSKKSDGIESRIDHDEPAANRLKEDGKQLDVSSTDRAQVSPAKERVSSRQPKVAAVCGSCGGVESVQVRELKERGTGLGIVGGALVGGVVGHQVGSGRGNDLATVAGAVGGGYVGNEIEKN